MAKSYRKPSTGGTPVRHETNPKGTALKGTPDPGAIPNHSPLSTPEPAVQSLMGDPGNPEKPGSKPLAGRSTPGRSSTTGLKGTPNNG